jgi:hypothetical protein
MIEGCDLGGWQFREAGMDVSSSPVQGCGQCIKQRLMGVLLGDAQESSK